LGLSISFGSAVIQMFLFGGKIRSEGQNWEFFEPQMNIHEIATLKTYSTLAHNTSFDVQNMRVSRAVRAGL
jgi:hypothetical protein